MQTIWLLSVSFCLFYKEVIGAPSTSRTSNSRGVGTAVYNRRTLLKPYLSKYNLLYQTHGRQYTGRNILSSTDEFGMIKPQLTYQNWVDIDNLPKTSVIYDDDINKDDEVTYNIYMGILYLLLQKIYYWVYVINDVTSILHYLGYQEETKDVINMSMTELLSRHRKRQIKIDSLAQLFYYSCDIQNMVGNLDDIASCNTEVQQKFMYFVNKFQVTFTLDIHTLIENELDLVENIKSYLRLIGEKTNASFGVTTSSMKLPILFYETDDEQINLIKNRIVSPNWNVTCFTLVWMYSNQDESNKINAYHLKVLGVIATHMFGYVYNHFELLSLLRRFSLQGRERRIIDEFKTFVSAYMSVFIDRYFEFYGEIRQELVDALFGLVYFLDPYDPHTPNINGLAEEEKRVLNNNEQPTVSIYNYYFDLKLNTDDSLDAKMWNLVYNAVEILLETFTDDNIRMHNWNQLTKIKYEKNDKKDLLQYMIINKANANSILEKFAKELSIDQNLYEKYQLNEPLQMP